MMKSNQTPTEPFFLIIADLDAGFFCIEGPMIDDNPWKLAAGRARENGRSVQCGPTSPNRDTLAIDYQQTNKLAGIPPGGIVRPRG